jgi:hypothetical protein
MRALYIILNSSTLSLSASFFFEEGRKEIHKERDLKRKEIQGGKRFKEEKRSKKLLETSKVTYLLAEASANLKIGICLRRVTKT